MGEHEAFDRDMELDGQQAEDVKAGFKVADAGQTISTTTAKVKGGLTDTGVAAKKPNLKKKLNSLQKQPRN
jgi:hypothetical protein